MHRNSGAYRGGRRPRADERHITRRRFVVGAVGLAAGGASIVTGAAIIARDPATASPTALPTTAPTVAATIPPSVAPTLAAPPTATVQTRLTSPPPTATRTPEPLAIEHASVAQLRRALDTGQLSVRELVQWSLDRIEAIDGGELGLGAVIELNPDALDIADVRDQELMNGEFRGPLHGIPILVKDLFATEDAMATTAGSLALVDNACVRDAFVISRLRQAGAVILGKTNLTEWSNFIGTVQSSGWSPRGGQTRNPYRLDHSPWGSSSGSAVAVAAGYVPLALGAETDGSIVCPASATATVGLKPTVGLTSRSGVIPISFTQDSPGPMARTVEDVAYLLTAIAGYDPEDIAFGDLGWTAPSANVDPFPVHDPGAVDYAEFLDPDGLRGARIGIARNVFPDADAGALLDAAIPILEAAGAEIVDGVDIPSAVELGPGITEYQVLVTEFGFALNSYLANYTPDGPMFSLADIVAFNEAHADEELAYHDQAVFYRALEIGTVEDAWYAETATSNLSLAREQGIDAALDAYELDALIAPTAGPPTPISLYGDDFRGSCSQVPAMAGYPILNVPLGYVAGLPVGLSFIGRAFSEPTLLKLAYAFEQAMPVRVPPTYESGAGE